MRRNAPALGGAATFAVAQQPGHGPGGGMMNGPGEMMPASRGYMEAMRSMQGDMATPMSGNADRDFLAARQRRPGPAIGHLP